MIHIDNITKKFDSSMVLKDFTLDIQPGNIYGVVGFNGTGKTTLLKTLCGIYRPEEGHITIDEKAVYENEEIKRTFFMVQEEPLFFPQATLKSMEKFYKGYYPGWSHKTFLMLSDIFGLDTGKRINGFSKGMQRQASIILALSTHPKYLLLDESFDGLDLAKRNLLQKILFAYLKIMGTNIIVSSHNLRELEGLCDYIAMIKDGELYFSSSVEELHQKMGSHMTLEEIFLEQAEEEKDYDYSKIFQ